MSWSSFFFALISGALCCALAFFHLDVCALVIAPAVGWFAYLTFAPDEDEERKYVLRLGGVKWTEADFCRGLEIDGRTGSGKTASGVVPIIHALKASRPDMGILALDTKGDLSEPLQAVAEELGRESDIRQLEVRPDNAPPDWKPAYTINILADRSIPYSTYAKILVDVATAAGQKGGQAFFKNAAQVEEEIKERKVVAGASFSLRRYARSSGDAVIHRAVQRWQQVPMASIRGRISLAPGQMDGAISQMHESPSTFIAN